MARQSSDDSGDEDGDEQNILSNEQSQQLMQQRLTESTIDETNNETNNETIDGNNDSFDTQNTPDDNLNKLFIDVGGGGRFQYIAYAIIGLAINSTGFWAYPMGYYIQQPQYKCRVEDSTSHEIYERICTAASICNNNQKILSWYIDGESDKTLINWQGKLDLMCAPSWKVGLLGTCLFVGWASTLLWLPRFGDKYGRKNVFAFSMSLNAVMYSLMMVTGSLDVMLVSIFVQGALNSIRVNIGFLYLLEMMPKHLQTTVGSIWGMTEACIYLLATIYFWKLSKDWFYFALIGYVMNVCCAAGAWFLPESPRYLLSKGRIDELKQVMQTIANVNRKQLRFHPEQFKKPLPAQDSGVQDVENQSPQKSTGGANGDGDGEASVEDDVGSSGYFLRQRPILKNLAVMTMCWLVTSFNYYLIQFLVNTFKQVYTTAIFSSISEMIGIAAGGQLYSQLGLKVSLSMSFSLALVGALLIIMYGLAHQDSYLFPLFVLIAKLGISSAFNILYVSHNDVFPVLFAATALGLANFVTRIFTGLSPILAQLEEPTPMLIFTVLCLLGCSAVYFIQLNAQLPGQPTAAQEQRRLATLPKLHEISVRKLKQKHLELAKKE